jgi:gliding motility-associated-like protein
MKPLKLFCFVVSMTCLHVAKAQLNIVDNGGFEFYTACPNGYSTFVPQVTYALGWKQPTFGTSDYFNTCSPKGNDAAVPKNYFGYQSPHAGNAYAGIFTYLDQTVFQPNLSREYVQTKLTRPLKAGRVYYFSMYVSLANGSTYRYSINNMGACVTHDEIKRPDADAFQYPPQVVSSTFLADTSGWMQVSGGFMAVGGEQYLTLGRFGPNDASTVSSLPGDWGNLYSYYFIDDVILIDSCAELDDVSAGILGTDTDYCALSTLNKQLNATNSKTKTYLWSTGQTTAKINVSTPGSYWVKMMNGNCFNYDTIKVLNTPKIDPGLPKDTAVCFHKPVQIRAQAQSPSYNYKWMVDSNGMFFPAGTGSFITVNYTARAILELGYSTCKAWDTISIHKSVMDTVRLMPDTVVCRKTPLVIDATTSGALSYKWSTKETYPIIATENQVPEILWAEVSDGLCRSRDSVKVTPIGSAPQPRDTSFCKGGSVTLYADPFSTYVLWNTGLNTASITIPDAGTYTLFQLKSGCGIIDTITVAIDSIPEIELGGDSTICQGASLSLLAYSPYANNYQWSNGDKNPFIVTSTAGKYIVKLSNKTCKFIDSVTISTQQNEPFTLGSDALHCFNQPVKISGPQGRSSYVWSDGSTDSVLTATKAGTYWLKTVKGSCINSDSIKLQQQTKPVFNLGKDVDICKGKDLVLDTKNAGPVYEWNDGSTQQQYTVKDSGIYWAKVTNTIGCWTIDSIAIDFYPEVIALEKDVEVLCRDSSHIITANAGMQSYLWRNGSTKASISVNTAGNYSVVTKDQYGCVYTDSVTVIEKPRPDVLTTTFYEACEPDFYAETTIPYKAYLWQDGSGLSTYHIEDYGFYALTITDSNDCWNSASIEVKQKCLPAVEVPNVFSPDGDGKNDRIMPDYKYMLQTDFTIYNRWGQILYHTRDITGSWDGSTPNGQAEPGVYYFTLKCIGNEKVEFEKTGTITLIR